MNQNSTKNDKPKLNVGRKPINDPRKKSIMVRYNEKEYNQLISEYSQVNSKLSLAEYVRQLSLLKPKSRIINKSNTNKLIAEINRIGVNANQISHQLNIRVNDINHKSLFDAISKLTHELKSIKNEISKL